MLDFGSSSEGSISGSINEDLDSDYVPDELDDGKYSDSPEDELWLCRFEISIEIMRYRSFNITIYRLLSEESSRNRLYFILLDEESDSDDDDDGEEENDDELDDDKLFEKEFRLHKRNYYITKMHYPEMTK